jgi:hypothetical protein
MFAPKLRKRFNTPTYIPRSDSGEISVTIVEAIGKNMFSPNVMTTTARSSQ